MLKAGHFAQPSLLSRRCPSAQRPGVRLDNRCIDKAKRRDIMEIWWPHRRAGGCDRRDPTSTLWLDFARGGIYQAPSTQSWDGLHQEPGFQPIPQLTKKGGDRSRFDPSESICSA
jgi:hypothetical protein